MHQMPDQGANNGHPVFCGLPPDPDNMNGTRAQWALQAVLTFAEETGQGEANDGLEEILGDLLVNLGHLADRNSLNFSQLIRCASEMYLEEPDGEGTQFNSACLSE